MDTRGACNPSARLFTSLCTVRGFVQDDQNAMVAEATPNVCMGPHCQMKCMHGGAHLVRVVYIYSLRQCSSLRLSSPFVRFVSIVVSLLRLFFANSLTQPC